MDVVQHGEEAYAIGEGAILVTPESGSRPRWRSSRSSVPRWARGGRLLPMRRGIASGVALLSVVALVTAGCGSSKPEFCSKTDDLQASLDTLKSDVTSANFSAIKTDAQTVKADADAVASSAKSDFPSETSAVESSISSLSAAVQSLPSSPSASDLARVASDANSVVTALNGFKSATSSKCD
jgi:hypothetical protein